MPRVCLIICLGLMITACDKALINFPQAGPTQSGSARLVEISGPDEINPGTCQAYTFGIHEADGETFVPNQTIAFTINVEGDGTVFSDDQCQTANADIAIDNKDYHATFYFKATATGTNTLTIPMVILELDPAVKVIEVGSTATAISVSGSQSINPMECQPYTAGLNAGTAVYTPTIDTTIDLALDGLGAIFGDDSCTTPIDSIIIAEESESTTFYIKGNAQSTLTLSLTATDLPETTLEITCLLPASLSLSDAPLLNFGFGYVGSSISATLTLTNDTGSTATEIEASLAEPFSFTGGAFPGINGTCESTLQGNNSCDMELQFTPTDLTSTQTTLTLNYNDTSSTQSVTRTLMGQGVEAGAADTSFGNQGTVSTAIGTQEDRAFALAINSDGTIIVAGSSQQSSTSHDFTLVKYLTDGSLDTGFGSSGKVVTAVTSGEDRATAVKILSDGKFLVGGYAANANYDYALVQYLSDGSLDTSFGTGGKLSQDLSGSNDYAFGLTTTATGQPVLAGYSYQSSRFQFSLAQFNTDGSLDSGFGASGVKINQVGFSSSYGQDVAIRSDGSIVVAGYGTLANSDFALAQYDSTGALDSDFGTSGAVLADMGGIDNGYALALQSDGKAVVAGSSFSQGSTKIAVARFSDTGTLDTSFNSSGKLVFAIPGSTYAQARDVIVAETGHILVVGLAFINSQYVFVIVKLTPSGVLDTQFASSGIKILSLSGSARAYGIALDSFGRICVAGDIHNGANYDFAVIRAFP